MSDGFPHRFSVHGVTIRSNHRFDGLRPPIPGAPEATIDFAGIGTPASASHPPIRVAGMETIWRLTPSQWLVRYDSPFTADAWSALVEAAGMTVRWTPGILVDEIPAVLVSSALAGMFLLRGVPLLHAAAVEAGGEAVLVMGDSGAGKSTTAAACLRRGCALLADDMAALEIRGDDILVHPGVPRLRMLEESATVLGWRAGELAPVFSSEVHGRKVFVEGARAPSAGAECRRAEGSGAEGASAAAGRGPIGALPVRAIHLLRPRGAGAAPPQMRTLPRAQALAALLRNAYAAACLDPAQRAWLLDRLGRVAERVPVQEVRAADSLEALPRLVDLLLSA